MECSKRVKFFLKVLEPFKHSPNLYRFAEKTIFIEIMQSQYNQMPLI